MSQQTQTNKIGIENGSVIYQAQGGTAAIDETYAPMDTTNVSVSGDRSLSFWKSPDAIEGAVQVNHKHAGWFTRGESVDSNGNPVPTWEEKIVQPQEFLKAKQLAQAGQDSSGLWGFSSEWYTPALEYISVSSRAQKEGRSVRTSLAEAGIIDTQTYPTLERINTQLALEQSDVVNHIFRQVATLETTDMLDIEKIYSFVGPGITRHTLGDYRVPYPKHGAFTAVELEELDKDMAHIAWSEDFLSRTYEVGNIREMNIASVPRQMELSKQVKIAVIVDAIGGTAKASWSDFTGANSNRNPYPDLDDVIQDISDNEGAVNTFVSNNGVYHAFIHNTFVTSMDYGREGKPFGSLIATNRVIGGADGVNGGLRWGIDNMFPDGDLAIYDRRAVRLRQGPTNVRDYTDTKTGVQGRIWKDFNLAYNWRASWTEKLTGLA